MNATKQYDSLNLRIPFLRIMAILGISLGGIGVVATFLIALQQGLPIAQVVLPPLLVMTISILWLVLVNRGNIRTATVGLLISLTITVWTPPPAAFVIAVVTVLAAAVLQSRPFFLLINAIVFVRYLVIAVTIAQTDANNFVVLGNEVITPLIILAISSLSTRYFFYIADRTARQTLRAAQLLQSTAEVAQGTSQILELKLLLENAIQTISQRFGFYHVQVFLVDDTRENAVLVASTGTVGRLLLDRQHKLAVGSRSVIGRVTAGGQPVLSRDSDANNIRFRNELLPETRAELAVPIRDGDEVIGALDVQSRDENAFDDNIIQALQVLSNLLASAIRNARLFEQQRKTARENESLYNQTRSNLDEIQRLNRELTGQAWRDFLTEEANVSGVTLDGEHLSMAAEWTSAMRNTAQGTMVYEPHPTGTRVALPLILRGEVIGAVEIDTSDPLTVEALAGVRAILERLSFSLENARLYAAAQSATAQEARLNQIAARYDSARSVEELLDITLTELSSTLGAERGAVRLGTHSNGGSAS
jgi:GAF domain-containing protein